MSYEPVIENEQWIPINNYPGYEVSDQGRIRSSRYSSMRLNKIKQPVPNAQGYLHLQLFGPIKPKNFTVAGLVASHFMPPPDVDSKLIHKDSNKQNNHVSNLEWKPLSKKRQTKKERPKPIQLTAQEIADEILEKGEIGKAFITSANLTINESIVTMVFTSSYAIQRLHASPDFERLVVNEINMSSISNCSSVSV